MEQRYGAVNMVMREGFGVRDVALKIKASRQTLYQWMADIKVAIRRCSC